VDEEALLEEDLESQSVLEEEVDLDVLEVSLDHLVHDQDETDSADVPGAESTDLDDLEIEDLEDQEESLDRLLREKLAGDEEPVNDEDEGADGVTGSARDGVSSCGPDEFVCPSCFLVRNRTQRDRTPVALCRDCSG
jgi:hypothetical protein